MCQTGATVVESVRLSIRFNSVKVLLAGLSLSEGPDPKIEAERSEGRFTADLTGGRRAACLQTGQCSDKRDEGGFHRHYNSGSTELRDVTREAPQL